VLRSGKTDDMSEPWDVVVIGGGPGGLAAAGEAAKGGARVAVCERNAEIGSPVRTTGGSFIADMEKLGIPSELYHVLHRCRFVAPHQEAVFDYPKPMVCVIDVRGTYQFLAERAAEAGAQIFVGHKAIAPLVTEGVVTGAKLHTWRGQQVDFTSKVLVDASGFRAQMLKDTGVYAGCKHFGVGAEYDLYAPYCNPDEAVLIVGNQVAPAGYGWAFPWGRKRVRVGIGILHADAKASPGAYLAKFIAEAARFKIDLRGAQPVEFHTGVVPAEGLVETLVADGIMAVGDAAGQASALVGEGIRWAIWGGKMAGTVAAEAVRVGDWSRQFLMKYQKQWQEKYGMRLRVAYEINRRIAKYDDAKWDERTAAFAALGPQEFADVIASNFTASFFLRAAVAHPEYLKLGLKKVVEKASGLLGR